MTSVKDLGQPKIVQYEQHLCHVEGHPCCGNKGQSDPSCSTTPLSPTPDLGKAKLMQDNSGKVCYSFPSFFAKKYMTQSCNYKGGGLGKLEQGMPSFPTNLGAQKEKKVGL